MSIILNSYIQNLTFQPQENNKNSYHLRGKKAAESQRWISDLFWIPDREVKMVSKEA